MYDITVCIPTVKSIDKLQLFLDRLFADVKPSQIHISRKTPLYKARISLIQSVKTRYFVFLDDDIIYQKGLIPKLYNYLISTNDPCLSVVQGSTKPIGLGKKWDRAFPNRTSISYVTKGKRFMTSNAILTTDHVKDWKPLLDVSGCEDWDLTNHILSKGYKIAVIPTNTLHKRTFIKIKSNAIWFARGYLKVFGISHGIRYLGQLLLGALKAFSFLPNHRLTSYTIYQNFFVTQALIKEILRSKI